MQAGDTINLSVKDKQGDAVSILHYCSLIGPAAAPCIRPKPEVMLQWHPQMKGI
jgi:hypothetical protein